jgi:hypothetical protein
MAAMVAAAPVLSVAETAQQTQLQILVAVVAVHLLVVMAMEEVVVPEL